MTKPEFNTVLNVSGLSVSFLTEGRRSEVVKDVSLSISAGQVLALVGQSGSGKSICARALTALVPTGADLKVGEFEFAGQDFTGKPASEYLKLRGTEIGYIFQEPLTTLNPALTVFTQMAEGIKFHFQKDRAAVRDAVIRALKSVELSDVESIMNKYPHQLSGGMRQRVMIASVLLLTPKLLVADEPTTALDPVLRQEVLALLKRTCAETNLALLFITHDIASMAGFADEIAVMQNGEIVERGVFDDVLACPKHYYTRLLLDAAPVTSSVNDLLSPKRIDAYESRQKLLELEALNANFNAKSKKLFHRPDVVPVLTGIDFTIGRGEFLGLVGASGAGKSTLARVILGLHRPAAGAIRKAEDLGRIQYIHQDASGALNPAMTVQTIVEEGLLVGAGNLREERRSRVMRALEIAGLNASFAMRLPHQLSGGQRQRVCIARALVTEPKLIVADEPLSALDVATQRKIITLFRDIRTKMDFACIFVTHDFGLVEELCDTVWVLQSGRIVEHGQPAKVFNAPQSEYTRQLTEASLKLERVNGGGYRVYGGFRNVRAKEAEA